MFLEKTTKYEQKPNVKNYKEQKTGIIFDMQLFAKLPKYIKPYVTSIDVFKDGTSRHYGVSLCFADGYERTIYEYGWRNLLYYLRVVIKKNRYIEI